VQGELIPILCYCHSINKSALPEDKEGEFIFEKRLPFIVGFFHGKQKPPVEELCKEFVAELGRLDPNNNGPETEGRTFTCSLWCMSCDSPMRYEIVIVMNIVYGKLSCILIFFIY